ncbi:PAAR domain-containing protein [Fulvimonas sp. R45]|uniref:PAAR domain-containing protein n=1 Tax=Fulvimonas sp. R45 TaxID=3045937 RepID=UPI00265F32E9|nr:PAAR domain-containing protein [Fulvimonas sp. R45]MDO1530090.1 PAAR domain-containing protein [Fulvimonas sp. R45]
MDGTHGPRRPTFPVRIVPLAALGARTNLGGVIATATSEIVIDGVPLATVGDTVHHPEYGDTTLITGCGEAMKWCDKSLACAGSLTGREGEFIVDTRQYRLVAIECNDGRVGVMVLDPQGFSDRDDQ